MRTVIGCLFAFIVFVVTAQSGFAQEAKPILKIEARLFESPTGKFSEDVLAPDAAGLGNVIIGENASSSTMVTVRIDATPPLPANAKLRLVAKETPTRNAIGNTRVKLRQLLDSTVTVPSTAAGNRTTYVGFWLPQTGCMPVALKAYLSAGGSGSVSASATLDFICYE
ncbi:hypothetical protein [Phyllobacterium sp. OV277]|uniref:hypothetical protein n=1 Tax=Phyllobacterium sp. OV277 TaxID=1882772 RepID=UPI00088E5131|nr:hypothetical protein [Phyllobacterium sp. OV277]SDP71869.1 hypothetical protein SAMN05443582_108157 [Phyllobacterium sp. OV277]